MAHNVETCALCGEPARLPAELDGVFFHFGTRAQPDSCFKQVQRGVQPLPDGRWWAQRWVTDFDGRVHQMIQGGWVTDNTWADGPTTETAAGNL